jgi:hypothetical protein
MRGNIQTKAKKQIVVTHLRHANASRPNKRQPSSEIIAQARCNGVLDHGLEPFQKHSKTACITARKTWKVPDYL